MHSKRIKNFPISFFAVTMGINGFLIALGKMKELLGIPNILLTVVIAVSLLIFVVLASLYIAKCISFPEEVIKELHHPVKMHFFPTFAVSLLLFSIAMLDLNLTVSKILWWIGAPLQLAFTIYTMTSWVQKTHFDVTHANPSWFIPILGNLIVPVAGVAHVPLPVNWFFFSVGFFFWVVMLAVIINRLIFHHPVVEKLVPTFFILMAPPAVAFISYVKITGLLDSFAIFLYSLVVFMVIFVLAQWRLFSKIKFYLSWWAYSFPLAAVDLATILYYHKSGYQPLYYMALMFFAALIGIVVFLGWLTIKHVLTGEICVEE
ncbi:SLAC1 anion channel family protein [Thermovirga sp.]|uniref:SLAC1 anion channel family protein n=1 Tax=Thermovirga sp. TaxID=2699834 RepID=UPI0025EEE9AC|nr:SLAC1 anion channel family protein [Thermovirga sp.]MBO8154805.1 C4-dicarboxylate ABC transporter [Thermovirga sp.]